jgi:HSP20 family protein
MYLRQLSQLQREMDQLFDVMSGARRPLRESFWRTAKLFPPLNVVERGDAYHVTAEIPGIATEDLEIKIEGDTLTLKGERKPLELAEGGSFHRRERATGTFQRSITLPKKVDTEGVKATYKDGILTVTLPTERPAAAKQISIKSE